MSHKPRGARRLARRRQKWTRAIFYAVIVVSVLGLASHMFLSAFSKPASPPLAGNVIDVTADMGGFNVEEIRVKSGEPVTIRLRSLDNQYHTDGGGKHQWAVDELGVNIIAMPEGTNHATFVPEKPGTYTFYCDVCCGGRANPTMQGTLIVEA